jgi:alanyl-tRNA synthetase/misacylated tRNA(Ala) deacylase
MLEKAAGKQLPPPKTSDIQDGFAFNRYECKEITPELVDSANSLFTNAVSTGAAVKTYADASKKGFRWWESLGFKIPCGGTHVADLGEIGDVTIAYSKKSGKQTVTITLNGDRNETP